MKTLATAAALLAIAAGPALARNPVFAAQCAGGVNQGGYNIDTDAEGHLWVNGHRVDLREVGEDTWEASYHGATFFIVSGETALQVGYNSRRGDAADCVVTATGS